MQPLRTLSGGHTRSPKLYGREDDLSVSHRPSACLPVCLSASVWLVSNPSFWLSDHLDQLVCQSFPSVTLSYLQSTLSQSFFTDFQDKWQMVPMLRILDVSTCGGGGWAQESILLFTPHVLGLWVCEKSWLKKHNRIIETFLVVFLWILKHKLYEINDKRQYYISWTKAFMPGGPICRRRWMSRRGQLKG